MPPDWTILPKGITETVEVDENGNFVRTRLVRFRVGTHGPFQLKILSEDFTADKLRAELDRHAAEIMALESGG